MLDKPYFRLDHDIFKNTNNLNNAYFRLYIYLLKQFNYFGNKSFYLTDEQIQKDIPISRNTIRLGRKRLKIMHLLDYQCGKWRKSATIYCIKGIIFNTESALKKGNKKEVIKEEINKEYTLSLLEQTRKTFAKQRGWL